MTPEHAATLQDLYAKSRVTWNLAGYLVDADPGVIQSVISASLANYSWPADEETRLRRILTILWAMKEHHDQLQELAQPLVAVHQKVPREGE